MSKRLLRGVIDFGDGKLSTDNQSLNFQRLLKSGFDWNNPDERKIFTFVREFVQENLEPPSAAVIRDFFGRTDDLAVLEKLKDIEAVEVYVRTSFKALLESLHEEQNQNKVRELLKHVDEIVTKGRIIEKEQHKGVKAGLLYFTQKIHELIPPDTNAKTRGEIREAAQTSWEEYQDAKLHKDKVWGRFTGIDHIDKVCHGIKRGELWVHGAAPGELKTAFALNWCYNLVTRYRANVLYVSLEMKFEHLQRLVTVMHTSNGKFRARGLKPLDYRKVRDGELTPDEERFYQEALDDFQNNPEYCRFEVWAPDRDVTVSDVRVEAEVLHKRLEVGMLVIDHDELLKSSRTHKDYTIERNAVLRELKKLALHFNGGEGIPVLDLHQINRQGKAAAEKLRDKNASEEGRYHMKDLSYANEVERSADYITTTYLNDELRNNGETVICNLKNRDNQLFDMARLRIDFNCRRLRNCDPQDRADIGHEEMSQEDIRALAEMGI